MIKDIKGKVVLITGASTGIGASAAVAFGRNAAKVVVHYNKSFDSAKQVAQKVVDAGGDAITIQGDVVDSAVCRSLIHDTVSHYGRIDVLINNAGGLIKREKVEDITDELFSQVVDLNSRSALMATSAAVTEMKNQGDGGSIINVSSIAARHGGAGGSVLYAASKGFISTMTRGFAKELAGDGIRVNAVSPGVIVTPFHDRYSSPELLESFRTTIPMGRLGESDECAGAFLYLASEELSGYVTGQLLEVNGGQYMP